MFLQTVTDIFQPEYKECSGLTPLLVQPDRQGFVLQMYLLSFPAGYSRRKCSKGGIPLGIDNYLF